MYIRQQSKRQKSLIEVATADPIDGSWTGTVLAKKCADPHNALSSVASRVAVFRYRSVPTLIEEGFHPKRVGAKRRRKTNSAEI